MFKIFVFTLAKLCFIFVQFQFLTLEMVVLQVLREFAGGTSIHGFAFLVSPKTSTRSKLIWAVLLVVAMMYATLEMRNSVISKYQYLFQNHKIETNDFLNTINTWLEILGHS